MSVSQSEAVFALDVVKGTDEELAIYAAGEGGVDRSLDLGATWTRLWSQGIAASVVVTNEPADGLIVAGVNSGVIRSVDWGATWTFSPFPDARSFAGCLSVDRARDGVLHMLAGTEEDGVYRSADAGLTWLPSNAGLYIPRIASVLIRDKGLWLAGTDAGLFVSRNQASTWSDSLAEEIDAVVTALVANDDVLIMGTASHGFLAYDFGKNSWQSVAGSRIEEEATALSFVAVGSHAEDLIAITSLHAQRFRVERSNDGVKMKLLGQAALNEPAVCAAIYTTHSEPYAVLASADGIIEVISFATMESLD